MSDVIIRRAETRDRSAIRLVEERAFGQPEEADLVENLVAGGDAVLELVAGKDGNIVGHILFSRLRVETGVSATDAVALAPLAVDPAFQRRGIGIALIDAGHQRLRDAGACLSVVLGDPAYYGKSGYQRAAAAGFVSKYQCDALQALAWGEAPDHGRLIYAPAFGAL